MNNIEFYKNRSLGERISAAAEFIIQNWKVMCKIILIPAIPLALLQGYFQQNFLGEYVNFVVQAFQGVQVNPNIQNSYGMYANMGIFYLVYLLYTTILYAISGALMSRYGAGLLSKETTLRDVRRKTVSNIGKLLLIGLLMGLMFVILYIIFVVLIVLLATLSPFLAFPAMFLLVIACGVIMPPMFLTYFPAFFQGTSVVKSIKKGLFLGFKNWGSTFVIMLIVGFALGTISSILQIPYLAWLAIDYFFHINDPANMVSYALSMLASLGAAFVTPASFIFFAFHYFSIAEKEEGISLQSKVEAFDNL